MSEKRFVNMFVIVDDNTEIMLKDKEDDVFYDAVSPRVEMLLNYFDVEMKKLKEENEQLQKDIEFKEEDLTYWKYKATKVLTELTNILSKYG